MSEHYTEWQVERFEQDAHDGAILEAGKEWERQQNEFNSREHELESRIAELEAEAKAVKENSQWLARLTESSRKENEHLRQTLSVYAAKQRWIPVSERLPEDGEVVWLWDGNNLGMGYYLVFSGQFMDRDTPLRPIKPSHWMPLPEPPIVYGRVCEE